MRNVRIKVADAVVTAPFESGGRGNVALDSHDPPALLFLFLVAKVLFLGAPRGGTLDLKTPMGVLRPRVPPGVCGVLFRDLQELLLTCGNHPGYDDGWVCALGSGWPLQFC